MATLQIQDASGQVKFTVSTHPLLTSPNDLQSLFNNGAKLLEQDDDGAGMGVEDDVSHKVSFSLSKAGQSTFPDQSASTFPAAERYDYRLARYNEIPNDTVGLQLLAAGFSGIKQVKRGHDFTGWANSSNKSLILTQQAIASTCVHEWGHLCGLPHRDSSNVNIMYSAKDSKRNEINRDEKKAMQSYSN